MSHAIYNTEGIILKSVNIGEANKLYFILTKDLGLIRATAQGVRLLKSKLRYGLMDYSVGHFALVRGKELWRLTSALKEQDLAKSKDFLLWARIFSLVLRLIQGEEYNDKIYQVIKEGIGFLSSLPSDLEAKKRNEIVLNFECILALRILSNLGYLGNLGDFNQFVESPYFTTELIDKMSALKTQAILEINKSLKETHL